MALINWDKTLSVGVTESDDQHKVLIQYINDLNDAMKQGKGKDAVVLVIDKLANYTATHFRNEERYFVQFNYPLTDEHKKLHQVFEKRIQDFKMDVQNGKLGTSIEVLNFLVSWLKGHILVEDKKYAALFNSRGVM
jgi:hemerythrin-like metal-binding protein